MTARFDRAWARASRAQLAASVGLLRALPASPSAARATPEQRSVGTPEGYRRSASEIAEHRALVNRLRRQKACLSEAGRAVFER